MIVSLDADFLSGASIPGFHKLVREYAERRKNPEKLNRLYAIESTPTTTGLKAEHRWDCVPVRFQPLRLSWPRLWALRGVDAPSYDWTEEQKKFLAALAKDLKAHAGKCVVIPGIYQDRSVESWLWPSTRALGNMGKTALVSGESSGPLPSDQIAASRSLSPI